MPQTAGYDMTSHTPILLGASPVAKGLLGLIWVYQKTLSILLGPRCRFYPSCSSYACECLKKYPLSVALKKTCQRLLKCHPFHPGGIDLP